MSPCSRKVTRLSGFSIRPLWASPTRAPLGLVGWALVGPLGPSMPALVGPPCPLWAW